MPPVTRPTEPAEPEPEVGVVAPAAAECAAVAAAEGGGDGGGTEGTDETAAEVSEPDPTEPTREAAAEAGAGSLLRDEMGCLRCAADVSDASADCFTSFSLPLALESPDLDEDSLIKLIFDSSELLTF